MNRVIKKIKKIWYGYTGNEDKFLQIKINTFREQGGTCGNNFKFYCDMPVEPYLVTIGDDVTLASGATLITHDNSVIKLGINVTDYFGKIKIGNSCFVGANSIILPGVTLGDRVIVGTGSVVTKSFKEGNIVIAGNPARVICSVEEFKEKKKNICINMDADNLRARKREYLSSLPENMFEHK